VLQLSCSYGPLLRGNFYKVVSIGSDWYLMQCGGKLVYCFKTLIGAPPVDREEEEEKRRDKVRQRRPSEE
jgi:hypothetical protein